MITEMIDGITTTHERIEALELEIQQARWHLTEMINDLGLTVYRRIDATNLPMEIVHGGYVVTVSDDLFEECHAPSSITIRSLNLITPDQVNDLIGDGAHDQPDGR